GQVNASVSRAKARATVRSRRRPARASTARTRVSGFDATDVGIDLHILVLTSTGAAGAAGGWEVAGPGDRAVGAPTLRGTASRQLRGARAPDVYVSGSARTARTLPFPPWRQLLCRM